MPQSIEAMPAAHTAETLSIKGPDAAAFAQAQFSSNVTALVDGQWQFSAWLDPQGRVRALFHLARISDDHLMMLLRGGDATELADDLRHFVFRSKVTLQANPSRALSTGAPLALHAVRNEVDDLLLGCDDHSLRIVAKDSGDDRWRLHQLRKGWPWLPTSALNALLPVALSLQRLGAVSVDKGCYPGQEIVARLHFRGGHKRHLHRVELSHSTNFDEPLRVQQRDIGRLLDVVRSDAGIEALAVLSDDFAAQHVDNRLTSLDNDIALRLCESWPA